MGLCTVKPIVVTGCQRSGTAWISAVITSSGYWCSHERYFREGQSFPLHERSIESSWAAAPVLDGLDSYIIHQVRHPLKVAASCMARSTFLDKGRPSAVWAMSVCKGIKHTGEDQLTRSLRYWVRWNRLVEPYRHHLWKLETLTPEEIAEVLTRFGRPVFVSRVRQAMCMMPKINSNSKTDVLTWGDVPNSKLKRRVMSLAEEYGYE